MCIYIYIYTYMCYMYILHYGSCRGGSATSAAEKRGRDVAPQLRTNDGVCLLIIFIAIIICHE